MTLIYSFRFEISFQFLLNAVFLDWTVDTLFLKFKRSLQVPPMLLIIQASMAYRCSYNSLINRCQIHLLFFFLLQSTNTRLLSKRFSWGFFPPRTVWILHVFLANKGVIRIFIQTWLQILSAEWQLRYYQLKSTLLISCYTLPAF